jgi:hypothetical protein
LKLKAIVAILDTTELCKEKNSEKGVGNGAKEGEEDEEPDIGQLAVGSAVDQW